MSNKNKSAEELQALGYKQAKDGSWMLHEGNKIVDKILPASVARSMNLKSASARVDRPKEIDALTHAWMQLLELEEDDPMATMVKQLSKQAVKTGGNSTRAIEIMLKLGGELRSTRMRAPGENEKCKLCGRGARQTLILTDATAARVLERLANREAKKRREKAPLN